MKSTMSFKWVVFGLCIVSTFWHLNVFSSDSKQVTVSLKQHAEEINFFSTLLIELEVAYPIDYSPGYFELIQQLKSNSAYQMEILYTRLTERKQLQDGFIHDVFQITLYPLRLGNIRLLPGILIFMPTTSGLAKGSCISCIIPEVKIAVKAGSEQIKTISVAPLFPVTDSSSLLLQLDEEIKKSVLKDPKRLQKDQHIVKQYKTLKVLSLKFISGLLGALVLTLLAVVIHMQYQLSQTKAKPRDLKKELEASLNQLLGERFRKLEKVNQLDCLMQAIIKILEFTLQDPIATKTAEEVRDLLTMQCKMSKEDRAMIISSWKLWEHAKFYSLNFETINQESNVVPHLLSWIEKECSQIGLRLAK